MNRFCFVCIAFTLFMFFSAAGLNGAQKTTRIRTGVIIRFDFTKTKPASSGKSPVLRQSSPAWAVLTVSLDPYRALSVFDYALRKDGTEYKCLDISEGNDEPFTGTLRNYRSSEGGKICRMVFAVPSIEDEYEIIFKLISGEEDPVKINKKEPLPVVTASVTLQESARLLGPERTPHKELSVQDAALKSMAAFALYEFDIYKETLSAEKAAAFKAPKLTEGLKKTKENTLKKNNRYEIIKTDLKENEALLTAKETVEETSKNYTVKMKKTENGWVVEDLTEQPPEQAAK